MIDCPRLAAESGAPQVAVIIATGHLAALAAKAATATIPIVFVAADDPVELGLVASLNRPGGNVTGCYSIVVELAAKRLGLLQRAGARALTRRRLSSIPAMLTETGRARLAAAARALGLQARRRSSAARRATSTRPSRHLSASRADALLVVRRPVLYQPLAIAIVALAARHRLPRSTPSREYCRSRRPDELRTA